MVYQNDMLYVNSLAGVFSTFNVTAKTRTGFVAVAGASLNGLCVVKYIYLPTYIYCILHIHAH